MRPETLKIRTLETRNSTDPRDQDRHSADRERARRSLVPQQECLEKHRPGSTPARPNRRSRCAANRHSADREGARWSLVPRRDGGTNTVLGLCLQKTRPPIVMRCNRPLQEPGQHQRDGQHGQNRLETQNFGHQGAIAAHLAGQNIGSACGRHRCRNDHHAQMDT